MSQGYCHYWEHLTAAFFFLWILFISINLLSTLFISQLFLQMHKDTSFHNKVPNHFNKILKQKYVLKKGQYF